MQQRVAEAWQEGWEAFKNGCASAVEYDNEHNISGKFQVPLGRCEALGQLGSNSIPRRARPGLAGLRPHSRRFVPGSLDLNCAS